MSRLNYNKWDKLELSDDSDIEVHPNVDKRSFIRFKQRELHEKREQEKRQIANWNSEIVMNNTLGPRLQELIDNVNSEGESAFERLVNKLRAQPSDEKPPDSSGPSYDEMVLNLLDQITSSIKEKNVEKKDVADEISKQLKEHHTQLNARTAEVKELIDDTEKEAANRITSDDLHDAWNSGHVNKDAQSAQPKPTAGNKGKTKEVEILNSEAVQGSENELTQKAGIDNDEEVPDLTESAKEFSRIPMNDWETSRKAISNDPTLLSDKVVDALLMEAFNAGMRNDQAVLRNCVHQGLLIQYCGKLGPDGVNLFFQRMHTPQAKKVFVDDVQATSTRISNRSREMAQERDAAPGEEAIQLAATDENQTITFDVPDGPPPEEISIEGEGAEEIDPEEVRGFLQRRWEIFESFPKSLQKALTSNSLEEVNRVLGKMALDEAEETVGLLDTAKILNFQSTDIVDQTKEEKSAGGN